MHTLGEEGGETEGAAVASGMPGRGGVSRGRADAELTWGEESEGRSDEFEARALDPARFLDPEHTATIGIGAAAPEVEPVAEGAGDAAIQGSSGRGAWRRRLAPHHREAVKQFFPPAGSGGR